jgi:hypothetical protein
MGSSYLFYFFLFKRWKGTANESPHLELSIEKSTLFRFRYYRNRKLSRIWLGSWGTRPKFRGDITITHSKTNIKIFQKAVDKILNIMIIDLK